MRFKGKNLSLALIWIGVLLVVLMGVKQLLPQQLRVVDMRRAIQAPATSLARSKWSESQQKEWIARYTALLPHVIQDYAKAHRVTIVSTQVLAVNNDADITDALIAETLRRLKHEP